MPRTRSRRDRLEDAAAVCPTCGAEFVAGVEACSDCRMPLVAPTPLGARLPTAEELVPLEGLYSADLARPLADALERRGLDHHLDAQSATDADGGRPTYLFEVYVRPEDKAAAQAIRQEVEARPGLQFAPDDQDRQPVPPPRLREFADEPHDAPPPDEDAWKRRLAHLLAIPFWWATLYASALASDSGGLLPYALAILAPCVALGLHATGWRLARAERAAWAQRLADEPEPLDWDALEEENRQRLAEAERVIRGEMDGMDGSHDDEAEDEKAQL